MNASSDAPAPWRFPRRPPGGAAPWALGLVCLGLAAGGGAARHIARYERAGLADGELWRLATGHLVHLGLAHTLLNVAALAVIAALLGDRLSRRDWLAGTLTAAAAIDAGLYWLEPGIDWYVGLSGVLHGIVLVGGARLVAVQPRLAGAVVAGLAAKLGWEALGGPSPWAAAAVGGPVVTAAHLYGTLGAAIYVGAARAWRDR